MDKAILEMPISKLIFNLFQVGLKKKKYFSIAFFFQWTLLLTATAINVGLKKRWRLKFLRILPSLPHPATDPQIRCCWQLGNLLFAHSIRIGRIILQEWVTQTVLSQFAVIHRFSDMILFSPSYKEDTINSDKLLFTRLLIYRNNKAHETKRCLMFHIWVLWCVITTSEFWKKSSYEWGIGNIFLPCGFSGT